MAKGPSTRPLLKRWRRACAHENTRYVLWGPLGALLGLTLLVLGRTLTEACFRGLGLAMGCALIDYGISAGVIKKRIRKSNKMSEESAPRYEGKAAVAFGVIQAAAGVALLIFCMLVRFE